MHDDGVAIRWWEHLILTRHNTHGLVSPEQTREAAIHCVAQIRLGWWRVFDYPYERVVAIVGDTNREGLGEVHIWADGGDLLKFGRVFMREVWLQTPYTRLVCMLMDRRMERFAYRLGWRPVKTGVMGERYWMISRIAS